MITEGEYMMTLLGFGCFMIIGILILAWIHDEL